MADEYVTSVILEINGKQIDDWKAFREGERETKKVIQLARKQGVIPVKAGYPLEVDYVVPMNRPEIDFEEEFDGQTGTLTIDLENGTRKVYTDVDLLKVGQTEYDGDKEAVRTISLFAMKMGKL